LDISTAQTFLEIVAAGSFLGAAEQLHVTQSTVSARVKSLEEEIGRTLFERRSDGVELTPAGEQFRRYATALVHTWSQAKLHVQVPPSYEAVVALGGQYTLWEGLLVEWTGLMRSRQARTAIRAEFGAPDELLRRLVEGTLDIAVMYTPRYQSGLSVEPLLVDRLTLVSSVAEPDDPPPYVYVDWGDQAHEVQVSQNPQITPPGIYVANAGLGLRYLLAHGGMAYLPLRLIAPHLASGKLQRVENAPSLEQTAYAVTTARERTPALVSALDLLHEVAAGNP